MKSSKTPRLRTKSEILQATDYFLHKFIVTFWDELLFKDEDLEKLHEALKIIESKVTQQNVKFQNKARA